MDWDDQFDPERFKKSDLFIEDLFTDRKRDLPLIHESPKARIDFIKDFIALANMSYRFGKVARMLFGIDNTHEIRGITQATKSTYLRDIDLNVELDREKFFNERTLRHFYREIRKYVAPSAVHLRMLWGHVKDNTGEDKLVAYLEIVAELNNRSAYRFQESKITEYRRFYRDFDELMSRSLPQPRLLPLSWKRDGESNSMFEAQEEYDQWLSATDCPVISGSKWKNYFNELQSGDFQKAFGLPEYQDPKDENGNLLFDRIMEFLESSDMLLVIDGAAGMGKTFFLRRLVFKLARDAVAYCGDLPDDAMPAYWLPIYRELRSERFLRETKLALKALVWWKEKMKLTSLSHRATRLFQQQNAKWILCLDALDEMDGRFIKNFKLALEEFRIAYPEVKIIITARPDVIDPEWMSQGIVTMMQPLNNSDIQIFLDTSIQGEFAGEQLALARDLLNDHPQLLQLVRVPLYLKAFADEFIPSDDQRDDTDNRYSLSRVLEKLLDRILEHDSKHFHVDNDEISTDERIIKLRRLAAKTDGANQCELEIGKRQVGGKKVLNRFLSIGFLERQNFWLRFRNDIVQCYLAARHLDHVWRSSTSIRKWVIKRLVYPPNSFWECAFRFYKEIAYDPESIHFVSSLIENQTDS